MLDTWSATRFERVLAGGATKPLVLVCNRVTEESPVPEKKNFVVKCLGLPRIHPRGLFCEVVGNLLARELRLSTPQPALIRLVEPFVQVTNSILKPHGLEIREGIGVGCEYFQGGYTSPVLGSPFAPEEVPQAVLLYGYDLLVQNPDRNRNKANCVFRGQQLVAFDFEMAFSFLLLVGHVSQAQPWEVSKHGIAQKHLFHSQLQRYPVSWRPLLDALDRLDLERFRQCEEYLPEEWRPNMARVVSHIESVKKNLGKFEVELQRSLS